MDKENKINIIVYGAAASGKSTIAALIYDYLKKCGFDNVMLKEDEGERIFHFLDQKIHALQERNTVIDIKTQQLKKLSLIKGEISYAENYIS